MNSHQQLKAIAKDMLVKKGIDNSKIYEEFKLHKWRIDVLGIDNNGHYIAIECGNIAKEKEMALKKFCKELILLPYADLKLVKFKGKKFDHVLNEVFGSKLVDNELYSISTISEITRIPYNTLAKYLELILRIQHLPKIEKLESASGRILYKRFVDQSKKGS